MKKIFLLLLIVSSSSLIQAQINIGGNPVSFLTFLSSNIDEVVIAAPDINGLKEDDQMNFRPYRFGVLLDVNISIDRDGSWEKLDDGSEVWRLKVTAENALALNPYFSKFYLPQGARLFLYDENKEQLKGAFTSENNPASGKFSIELINGESFILEYFEPSGVTEKPVLEINGINYAYRGIPAAREKGFGGSDPCEVNINCSPEGDDWQDEKRGVARILIKMGKSTYWCTGSLVNNTSQDTTPYLLTADHCAFHTGHYATPSDLNQWIFYFNYEKWDCGIAVDEPGSQTMVGATKMASGGEQGSTGSDFYLLRLNHDIPLWYHPYYNGWLAMDSTSKDGVTIHHPEGDIKKISHYTQELTTTHWPGGNMMSHWQVFWSETENNWGVTEPGSSGCPLFNSSGKIIGSLSGGEAACDNQEARDLFGKVSYHWESNGFVDSLQLKPWLDPLNLGTLSLNGLDVTTGIEENKLNDEISFTPNPATDVIWFKQDKLNKVENFQIIDVFGREISSKIVNSDEYKIPMDISFLQTGFYVIRVIFEDGHSLTAKVCKK